VGPLDRLRDGAQQHVVVEWLRQEPQSSRLHRLERRRHIAVTVDKDDPHVDPIGDALLRIETIEVGKRNVK
jgi:hypothetical protein